MTNFASSKTDLSFKYRLGLEHALAKADFLNHPDLVLVQAFTLFLCLARRHDSPRFVWMMTGLVVRMAQYIGLQRDGSHFDHLSPFEIEMRRRIWWVVCLLDARASQDQGTDLIITSSSFDTQIPLNINDDDISVESKDRPTARHGVTDSTLPRVIAEMTKIQIEMMTTSVKDGEEDLEDQRCLLSKIYERLEQEYLQHTMESADNVVYWVGVTVARLTMAKMTLLLFLPAQSPYSSEHISDEIESKLLIPAIEVAEYNHELNAKHACRQWRWVYQTYTHWCAIVYLMIEISQRSWSPLIERAWVALHSSWLIPAPSHIDKNLRIWVPLRKLMEKARKHRDTELKRLRADPQAAARLAMEDQKIPSPSSSGPFPDGSSTEIFRERWRQLVAVPNTTEVGVELSRNSDAGLTDSSVPLDHASQSLANSILMYGSSNLNSGNHFAPTQLSTGRQQADQTPRNINVSDREPATTMDSSSELLLRQSEEPSHRSFPIVSAAADWSEGSNLGPGFVPWPLTDADPSINLLPDFDMDFFDFNMDLDGEVNRCSWLEFAKGLERDAMSSSL